MSVTINNYNKSLAQLFLNEKSRLQTLLPKTTTIEHVGSSAVGIGGKNIIDILVGATDSNQMDLIKNILTDNGYYSGNDNHDDRLFLANRQEETGEGDFHIHICPINSQTYKDFLILRDYLKENPAVAEEYQKNKQRFAEEAGFDRKKYKALKSAYVSALLAKAKNRL